jgi:hypothetical protein
MPLPLHVSSPATQPVTHDEKRNLALLGSEVVSRAIRFRAVRFVHDATPSELSASDII